MNSPPRPAVFVEVAVPLPIDHPFTYRVPAGGEARAKVGVRALVPFGARRVTGLVTALSDGASLGEREAKEVLDFLDEEPYIPPGHLAFLLAAARECLAPAGEMLRAALPRGLSRRDSPPSPRTETVFRPANGNPDAALTPKQRKVYSLVLEAEEIASADLSARISGGGDVARRLAARGILSATVREKPVGLTAAQIPASPGGFTPTLPQEAALARIGVAVASRASSVFVLHGITGSGKTEVYLRAIEQVRAAGRQAVYLVPEISLTPQLLGRVRARFGDGVAVLHSGLSPAERTAQWRRVRAGEVFLSIGARSAVFSPFASPGLFIVDEEHDTAYKQEEGIRYQARDLALLRGRMEDAVVLLGSATPSAEAIHLTRTGEATMLSLPERIGARGLPEISVVDLRSQAGRRGADRYFSAELEAAVEETLLRREKAMLFLNRRGYAPALTCLDCGTTVQCNNCQVSMTFHRQDGALLCHYCDARKSPPEECPGCGGHKVVQVGIGTERLVAWAGKRWADARVERLDSDLGRKKGVYGEVLSRMARGEVDILVGTQVIAKGHDFPEVTFVGVLLADLSLSFPDFRSAERTFQLLTQVSGRAGRGSRPGKVILQTLSPEHVCIRKAAEHDFRGFMEAELSEREALGYPPYGRMLLLRLWGSRQERVREAAEEIAAALADPVAKEGIRLLGPAPSPIPFVKRKYRYQILLKMPPRFPVGDFFPGLLRPLREFAGKAGVRMEADVDPYNLMV
ncbi:MAG: primosomal protein N' [Deltaproteobacteria bacterium GWC2_65_14]|nr:MAG: primosomal protein N' [Deltaproteobacteria bacterium GWC2_65_14]